MVIGAIGTVLTAGYMLWMLQKVNFGEPKSEWDGKHFHDVDGWEMAAWVPLVVAIIAIGIYPKSSSGPPTKRSIDLVATRLGG